MSKETFLEEFRALHRELTPSFARNCFVVAAAVGQMARNASLEPVILRFLPVTGATLNLRALPDLAWPQHITCAAMLDGVFSACDPFLAEPQSLVTYTREGFAQPVEWNALDT